MPVVVVVVCLVCSNAGAAFAQSPSPAQPASPTLPIERFRVPIDDTGLGTTEGGAMPPHMSVHTALLLHDAVNPLVLTDEQGARISSLVANRLAASLAVSLGLFDVVALGAELPVALLQNSGDLGALQGVAGAVPFAVSGVGDLKLVPKIRLLREDQHGASLALLLAVSVPTSSGFDFATGQLQYGASYLGEGPAAFAFLPEVALSTHVNGARVAANVGYRLRAPVSYFGTFDIYPELNFHLGAGYELKDVLAGVDVDVEGLLLYAELLAPPQTAIRSAWSSTTA